MVAIRRLVWDPVNVRHIARHGVNPHEVEDVCRAGHISFQSHLGRLAIIGQTEAGRALTVVLELESEPETYYVVTARPSSRKERRHFRQQTEGQPQ